QDKVTGAYAFALTSTRGGPPVIVFRGTKLSVKDLQSSVKDLLSNLNRQGVGNNQFQALKPEIIKWVQDHVPPGATLLLTGHSKGGAEAQLATLALNDLGYRVELDTWGSPGISRDQVARFQPSLAKVTHNRTVGDPVPAAG